MSFTCTNCNTPLTAGSRLCPGCGLVFDQPVPAGPVAPVMRSAPASTSTPKKAGQPWAAALLLFVGIGIAVLFVAGIGIMGLANASNRSQEPAQTIPVSQSPQIAQADPVQSPASNSKTFPSDFFRSLPSPASPAASATTEPATAEATSNDWFRQTALTTASRPTGVLTFSNFTNFFDYNIATHDLTDNGPGKYAYRAKNGYALVESTDNTLVLVSPDGKTRRTITRETIYSGAGIGFVLSPDGKTAIYDRISNDPRYKNALVVHNVQTGAETPLGYPDIDWPVPQDWMPDGRLLFSPFGEQKAVSDRGETISINYGIVSKDLSSTMVETFSIDQPGTKPVDDISDPRIDPSVQLSY